MALTTTTLAAACAITDTQITVTAATSFAANSYVKVDEEFMKILSTYTTGTVIPVRRGLNGTVAAAHVITANAVMGTPSQFSDPSATVVTSYPLSARRRKVTSYSASGAITLPASGEDVVAILNGTSALAMTLAVPTKDDDGALLYVVANGKAAHTVTAATAIGDGGSNLDLVTFAAGGQNALVLMAVNGIWVAIPSFYAGTLTNITATFS